MTEDTALSRRGFLRVAAGSATAAGAAGGVAAQEGNETDGGGNQTATGTPAGNQSGGGGGNQTGGNQTGANQTGANQTGGNQTGGNQTGGNQTGGNQTGGNQSGSGNQSGGGGGQTANKTVTVGPGGELTFDPETVKVTPGSTVTWKWDSDNHNIVVQSQPDGANWEGHESIENAGFTYQHTFNTKGTYEYFCQPHKSAGMTGTVEVVESISTPGGGGGGGPPPVPDSARTLGVATTIGMLSTLGLAYFFLKYGGDYETPE